MNALIAKFSPDGDPLWTYTFNTEWSRGYNVKINSNDEIICTGVFMQSGIWFDNFVLENPGLQARYIMKLSPEGELVWIKCIYVDFPFNQSHSLKFINIDFDSEDNIFMAGFTSDDIYLDGNIIYEQSIPFITPFVLKFDSDGDFQWLESFTTNDPSQNELWGLSVNNEGSIACAGWYSSDSLTFFDTTLNNTYERSFIIKMQDKDNQQINLDFGWSYISSYIIPDTPNMAQLFQQTEPNLKIIKNSTGDIYWPQFSLNMIGDYNTKEGYQICMNSSDTLIMHGYRIRPQETELPLDSAWQIIPYLRITPQLPQTTLSTINSNIIIMKNTSGHVYWPAWNVNAIGTMKPGCGYAIKMLAQDTLIYPVN